MSQLTSSSSSKRSSNDFEDTLNSKNKKQKFKEELDENPTEAASIQDEDVFEPINSDASTPTLERQLETKVYSFRSHNCLSFFGIEILDTCEELQIGVMNNQQKSLMMNNNGVIINSSEGATKINITDGLKNGEKVYLIYKDNQICFTHNGELIDEINKWYGYSNTRVIISCWNTSENSFKILEEPPIWPTSPEELSKHISSDDIAIIIEEVQNMQKKSLQQSQIFENYKKDLKKRFTIDEAEQEIIRKMSIEEKKDLMNHCVNAMRYLNE